MYCTITAHNNQFTYLHNSCPACCGPETTIKEENLHKDIKNIVWIIHNTILQNTHTVHSPTDAHLLKLLLQFTLKLHGSYMFRSTTIIRELAVEPG